MCGENNSANKNCMYEILKTILVLQKESNMPECCLDTCDKKCLGCTPSLCAYNTRPITIYTCGCCNTGLQMPISKLANEQTTSNLFFLINKFLTISCICSTVKSVPRFIYGANSASRYSMNFSVGS